MGIYGLVSANRFNEYITGKDMFGNELTVEQQQNSLYQALGLLAVGGGAYYVNRLQAENAVYQVSITKPNNSQSRGEYLRNKYGEISSEELHRRINVRGINEEAIKHGSNKTWDEFLENKAITDIEKAKNSYITLIKEQSPWPEGFIPKKGVLKSGDTFEMVLDNAQPIHKPGSFGTFDKITGIEYAKENLAIKSNWKEDFGKVVTYRVKQGVELPVLEGPVGPQIDLNADKYLPGGGTQIQIMLDWKEDKMNYLEVIAVRANK